MDVPYAPLSTRLSAWADALSEVVTVDRDVPGEQREPGTSSIAIPHDAGHTVLAFAEQHGLRASARDGLTAEVTDPGGGLGNLLAVTRSRWPAREAFRLMVAALEQWDLLLQAGRGAEDPSLALIMERLRLTGHAQTLPQFTDAVITATSSLTGRTPGELWYAGSTHLDVLSGGLSRIARQQARALAFTDTPAPDTVRDTAASLIADHGPDRPLLVTEGRDRQWRRAAHVALEHADRLATARALTSLDAAAPLPRVTVPAARARQRFPAHHPRRSG